MARHFGLWFQVVSFGLVLAFALGGLSLPATGYRDAEPKGQAQLEIDDRAECGASVAALWTRVEARSLGAKDGGLVASVRLQAKDNGVEVTIRIRSSTRLEGSKTLVVPACEEADDTIVALVALAFSRAVVPEEPTQPFPREASTALVSRSALKTPDVAGDTARLAPAESERSRSWGLLGDVGIDLPLGRSSAGRMVWGVGALGRWGLNSLSVGGQLFQAVEMEEEESLGAQSELSYSSWKADTFGLNAAYCRRLSTVAWLDFCGGVQVNIWRSAFSDVKGAPGNTEVTHEWSADSLLGVRVSENWRFLQPNARLAVRLPVVGHPDGYDEPALVGSLGIGMIF